jgi:hypothetical protein
MADKIRRIDYYYATVPDRPGEGARLLGQLKESGVNLLSLTAFPLGDGRSQIDFVPENADALLKAAQKARIDLSPKKTAIFVQGKDRPGAAAEIFKKLADAGVNVHAANAACGGAGGFGMIVWVKPHDVQAAAKALGI